MPNCDWGSPCDCSECYSKLLDKSKKCCRCDEDSVQYDKSYETDRKGISYYSITGFCQLHHNEKKLRLEEDKKKQMELFEKLKLEQDKYTSFIKNIESNNKVPIGVAKNKGYFRHPLIDELLIVEKINKRYKCSKERLEHFDFNLFQRLYVFRKI